MGHPANALLERVPAELHPGGDGVSVGAAVTAVAAGLTSAELLVGLELFRTGPGAVEVVAQSIVVK